MKLSTKQLNLHFAFPLYFYYVQMKWGYANTAAIVRSLQKDFYYRQQLLSDLKLILLDHLNVGVYLKLEEWLPVAVDLLYYTLQTGRGRLTLGEAYSNLVPVDLDSRDYFLKDKAKRILWVVMTVLVPFAVKKGTKSQTLKKIVEIVEPFNSILFYYSGKYPSIINRFLSIRYIFQPRRPPMLDEDALIYKGLAVAIGILSIKKMSDFIKEQRRLTTSNLTVDSAMKPAKEKFKCPVCFDSIEGAAFASIKCGHVYCWHCIYKWMTATEEMNGSCPVCRVPCEPPDLLPLANLK